MDAFAAGGAIFERAYSTSSYTLASHASLLGAEWDDPMEYWRCDCPILGQELQDRGYATAGFSSNPYWFTREYGFARGFHHFDDFFDTPADAAVRTTFGRAVERLVLPRPQGSAVRQ
jgi:arylsulfatase A-like enzyme